MTPIAILAPDVANAIAAGEVVERPAAVVKELCENAIDAKAAHVTVTVEGGGLTSIVVADDGMGIPSDELELALQRHATSKLTTRKDLAAIGTLGFRGEALASIAAVSRMTMTSSCATGSAAQLTALHGRTEPMSPAGRARGTTVEVLDLFASTPARLAFMKSERSEQLACVRIVHDMILTSPNVAISLRGGSKVLVSSSGGGEEGARESVFGATANRALLAGTYADERGLVNCWISQPSAHRGDRTQLFLIVNGRRVHNPRLLAAILDAYRGSLPVSRYPFGVLTLTLDPADVDVNVHPTKREVRFRRDNEVFGLVARACRDTLLGAPAPTGEIFRPAQGQSRWDRSAGHAHTIAARPRSLTPSVARHALFQDLPAVPTSDLPDTRTVPLPLPETVLVTPLAALHPLGQLGTTWIVAQGEGETGMVLVDAHAAHERILYNRISLSMEGGPPLTLNELLIPVTVETALPADEILESLHEVSPFLGSLMEVSGPHTLSCRAAPSTMTPSGVEAWMREIAGGEGLSTGDDNARHRQAALLACHSAIRFGDRLALEEQRVLLNELMETEPRLTCPHGRPTMITFDDATLRRAFGRPT